MIEIDEPRPSPIASVRADVVDVPAPDLVGPGVVVGSELDREGRLAVCVSGRVRSFFQVGGVRVPGVLSVPDMVFVPDEGWSVAITRPGAQPYGDNI
jgi:hypothetical protein